MSGDIPFWPDDTPQLLASLSQASVGVFDLMADRVRREALTLKSLDAVPLADEMSGVLQMAMTAHDLGRHGDLEKLDVHLRMLAAQALFTATLVNRIIRCRIMPHPLRRNNREAKRMSGDIPFWPDDTPQLLASLSQASVGVFDLMADRVRREALTLKSLDAVPLADEMSAVLQMAMTAHDLGRHGDLEKLDVHLRMLAAQALFTATLLNRRARA